MCGGSVVHVRNAVILQVDNWNDKEKKVVFVATQACRHMLAAHLTSVRELDSNFIYFI